MRRRTSFPAFALLAIAVTEAPGQMAFSQTGLITAAQRAMPASGPGSSRFNPAALSETRLIHLVGGSFNTVSGKAGQEFQHLSVATPPGFFPESPFGIAAGLDLAENSSSVDNSTAIYREQALAPAVAVFRHAGEEGWNAALGMALPFQYFDAFGAVESWSSGLEAGMLGSHKGSAGAFRLGFSYHNLISPEARLPDARGEYELPGWMELSLEWTSSGRRFRTYLEHYLSEPHDRSEGPATEERLGLNAWEFEYLPHPILGLKVERPRNGRLISLGLLLRPSYRPLGIHGFLEANLGHERFAPPHRELPLIGKAMDYWFGKGEDEGRGATFGLTLGVGL